MALDNVVGQILESANKEADTLTQEAEREKASILKQADEQLAVKQKAEQKDLEQTLTRMRQQELSSAELEAKRVTLNARKQVLDNTFQTTLKDLGSMGVEDKTRLYKKILNKGLATLPNAKVFCPKGDSKYVAGAPGVRSVEEKDMEPGLILESADGTVSLDYRFKTILEGVWEKELKNVSNILFG
jgi:V/A-type H+-transporting ATPase subunit E